MDENLNTALEILPNHDKNGNRSVPTPIISHPRTIPTRSNPRTVYRPRVRGYSDSKK